MKEVYLCRPFQSGFKISSNSSYVIDFLRIHYGQYISCTPCVVDYNVKIHEKRYSSSNHYLIEYDEYTHFTDAPIDELMNYIRTNSVFNKNILALHGAAVERNSRAYLFLAPTLTGKTTLTCYLCNNGFKYITDDCILINRDNLFVYPYCLPMHLRNGGIEALKTSGLLFENLPCLQMLGGKRYIYTPPVNSVSSLKIEKILFLTRTVDDNQRAKIDCCDSMAELLKAPLKNYQLDSQYIRTLAELATINCEKVNFCSMTFLHKILIDK